MYHNKAIASTSFLWYGFSMTKKRGRPRTPRSKAFAKFFSIRMRPDESGEVLDAIERSGMPKSDWIRAALLDAARKTGGG